jgi:hypothetical protein
MKEKGNIAKKGWSHEKIPLSWQKYHFFGGFPVLIIAHTLVTPMIYREKNSP